MSELIDLGRSIPAGLRVTGREFVGQGALGVHGDTVVTNGFCGSGGLLVRSQSHSKDRDTCSGLACVLRGLFQALGRMRYLQKVLYGEGSIDSP